MYLAICHFSLEESLDSRLLQRIQDKVFAKFKLILSDVGGNDEFILAGALLSKDENYLRSFFAKISAFIEESEGVRLQEHLEIIQR